MIQVNRSHDVHILKIMHYNNSTVLKYRYTQQPYHNLVANQFLKPY